MYSDEFAIAKANPLSFGYSHPMQTENSEPLLSEKLIFDVFRVLNEKFGVDEKQLANNCLEISMLCNVILSEKFKIASHYTIGSYIFDGNESYKAPVGTFNQMLKSVEKSRSSTALLKSHVWLTLSSGEIFDPTIVSSILLKVLKKNASIVNIVGFHCDQGVDYKVSHHPSIVGQEFLVRSNRINSKDLKMLCGMLR